MSNKFAFEQTKSEVCNDAHIALVRVFAILLKSNSIKVETVRSAMRVQLLASETKANGARFEAQLIAFDKKQLADAIGDQLLLHQPQQFASAWNVSDLLKLCLPLRDWRKKFLVPLEDALCKLAIPSGCTCDNTKLDEIFNSIERDPTECLKKVTDHINHIENTVRRRTGNYGLRKKRSLSSSSSSSSSSSRSVGKKAKSDRKKSTSKPKFCSHCGTKAAGKHCSGCGKKI